MTSTLAAFTTLRLGGPAGRVVVARDTAELIGTVRRADQDGEPVLLVGGGSNLVVADAGWPGVVIRIATQGIRRDGELFTVAAGVDWDCLVEHTIAAGFTGLETMSGVPGLVGATPVQNVGAYGADVSQVITALTVFDRQAGEVIGLQAAQCEFGFRTSVFKHCDRYVILDVTMRLTAGDRSRPVRYLELARRLGVEQGGTAAPGKVRAMVLELRRGKGMLLDADDHDTWSVGSFFVNPLLATVPDAAAQCPSWAERGSVKLSAAWLIEHAGFGRGFGLDRGRGTVAVSTKHALALTNRGGASTAELMELAAVVRDGVAAAFGINLGPEASLRGCAF